MLLFHTNEWNDANRENVTQRRSQGVTHIYQNIGSRKWLTFRSCTGSQRSHRRRWHTWQIWLPNPDTPAAHAPSCLQPHQGFRVKQKAKAYLPIWLPSPNSPAARAPSCLQPHQQVRSQKRKVYCCGRPWIDQWHPGPTSQPRVSAGL